MKNIVTEVIGMAGGRRNLAQMHNVTTQSVVLWEKQGYFPLKQMPKVLKNFKDLNPLRLIRAYELFLNKKADNYDDN